MFVLYHPAHLEYKIRNYRRLHLFARVFASFALSGGRRAPCNEAPRAIVFRPSAERLRGLRKARCGRGPLVSTHRASSSTGVAIRVTYVTYPHGRSAGSLLAATARRNAGGRRQDEGQGARPGGFPRYAAARSTQSRAPRAPGSPAHAGGGGPCPCLRACPARTRRRREELRRPIYVAGASGAAQIPTGVPSAVDLSARDSGLVRAFTRVGFPPLRAATRGALLCVDVCAAHFADHDGRAAPSIRGHTRSPRGPVPFTPRAAPR
jgi:hypothetical protein